MKINLKYRQHYASVKILLILSALLLAAIFCLAALQKISHANTLSNWNPGMIIDDQVMTKKSSMSVSQIQSFLNGKVKTCDTNGQQLSEFGGPDLNSDGKVQRWEYGKHNYNQTTFPCLKDYKQDGVSAAQLIYNASQTYSINPQVLIVLLQKEQGLVTDTWPLNIQYRSATGYGCPDTAACDSKYYGLKNQLNWAATMFRAIINNDPNWYTPYVLGKNYIQYNPNASCGGTTVDIKNRSTQALYNYTPYQPNKAALSAGYGGGDSCSAHGNRNFYLYFTDWFGSTQGTPFFRIGNTDPIYILGSDNNYYHVSSWATMRAYGWGEVIDKIDSYDESYLSDKVSSGTLPLVVKFGTDKIYLMNKGLMRHVSSLDLLEDYGYKIGDEAKLPSQYTFYFRTASSIKNIAKDLKTGGIYLIDNGKKRHFSNPDAYHSGDPAFSSLLRVDLTNEFLSTLPNNGSIYAPGTLIRVGSTSPVYIIEDNLVKSHIPNRQVLDDFNLDLSTVKSVDKTTANAYATTKSLNPFIVKLENDGLRLVTLKGTVYAVPSSMSQKSVYNINTNNLTILSNSTLSKYKAAGSVTELIRAKGHSTIYKVENGKKRHISSPSVLNSLGYTFDDVTDVSSYLIDTIPTDAPIK